ncbi:hypothetical protein Tco_0875533 [Tanacetum coccineum]|uniref:CCHC-type domain-containing protein n=1 Tax=Tanacetum coccineum TaxID=301880 RepID=A0ABQ5BSK9_9ASTR
MHNNIMAAVSRDRPHWLATDDMHNGDHSTKDKDMQKNLALIAKYFKKIYKPTNNNLRTSSNTKNKNVDTTPRYKNDNQTGQIGNQRAVNVVGAREIVGGPVVQQSGIQCFNCKEFGHLCKEMQTKSKRSNLTAQQTRLKTLMKQELEAHYVTWQRFSRDEITEITMLISSNCQELTVSQKLSEQTEFVSKEIYTELLRSFAKLEKHSISLEIALQECQEQLKNDTVYKEMASAENNTSGPVSQFKFKAGSKSCSLSKQDSYILRVGITIPPSNSNARTTEYFQSDYSFSIHNERMEIPSSVIINSTAVDVPVMRTSKHGKSNTSVLEDPTL